MFTTGFPSYPHKKGKYCCRVLLCVNEIHKTIKGTLFQTKLFVIFNKGARSSDLVKLKEELNDIRNILLSINYLSNVNAKAKNWMSPRDTNFTSRAPRVV